MLRRILTEIPPADLLFRNNLELAGRYCADITTGFPEGLAPAAPHIEAVGADLRRLIESLRTLLETLPAVAGPMNSALGHGTAEWSVSFHSLVSNLREGAEDLESAPGWPGSHYQKTVHALRDAIPEFERRRRELEGVWAVRPPPPQEGSLGITAVESAAASPLTADHELILTFLAKTPAKCMTVIAVASTGPIRNRETVGRLLAELAQCGLVHRPHGKRKGYALTSNGSKRVAANKAAK